MIGSAALIVIGSELTRGIIQDRHGQLVSRAMSGLGIHMSQIVEVPDDGSIASILSAIVRKNDLVVITGGLGPTSDDMTRQCIAAVASSPLERNEESWNALHERIGEKIHGANEKQTMIPRSFCRIANANGTADGFYGYTPSGCLIVALPGPPREMQPMFESVVVPLVSRLSGHGEVARREYTSFITAEAKLEELTQQVAPDLTWATRFQDYCISLYLSGGDEKEKDRAVSELRRACGSHLIADGDTSALGIRHAHVACRRIGVLPRIRGQLFERSQAVRPRRGLVDHSRARSRKQAVCAGDGRWRHGPHGIAVCILDHRRGGSGREREEEGRHRMLRLRDEGPQDTKSRPAFLLVGQGERQTQERDERHAAHGLVHRRRGCGAGRLHLGLHLNLAKNVQTGYFLAMGRHLDVLCMKPSRHLYAQMGSL